MSVEIGDGYRELRQGKERPSLGDEWFVEDSVWQPVPHDRANSHECYEPVYRDWVCRRKRTVSDDVLDRMKIFTEREDWPASLLGYVPEQLRADLSLIVTEWMEDRS